MSMQAPTYHIAAQKGDFAQTVLMAGNPLRSKFIAETYLEDVKQINGICCFSRLSTRHVSLVLS